MDPASVPGVTISGEVIIGGLVSLVGIILGFTSKVVLQRLKELKEEQVRFRDEMLQRLRTLGHEDRETRSELHEARKSLEASLAQTLQLVVKVFARRGALHRAPLDEGDNLP